MVAGAPVPYKLQASRGSTDYEATFAACHLPPACVPAAALAAGFKSFDWWHMRPPSEDAIAAVAALSLDGRGGRDAGSAADWREFCDPKYCPIIAFIARK